MKTLFYKHVRLTLAQTSLGETTQLVVETVAIAIWFKPFPWKYPFCEWAKVSNRAIIVKCVGQIVRDADLLGLKEHLPSKRREMMLSTFNSPSAIFQLIFRVLWTRSTLWCVGRGRCFTKQGYLACWFIVARSEERANLIGYGAADLGQEKNVLLFFFLRNRDAVT